MIKLYPIRLWFTSLLIAGLLFVFLPRIFSLFNSSLLNVYRKIELLGVTFFGSFIVSLLDLFICLAVYAGILKLKASIISIKIIICITAIVGLLGTVNMIPFLYKKSILEYFIHYSVSIIIATFICKPDKLTYLKNNLPADVSNEAQVSDTTKA